MYYVLVADATRTVLGTHSGGAVMFAMQKSPKEVLLEVYETHNIMPHFMVGPYNGAGEQQRFRCNLKCPEVTAHNKMFQTTSFTALASTQEGAEQDASMLALIALRTAGIISPSAIPQMYATGVA